MRPYDAQEKAWLTEYYRSAIGLTITGVEWTEEVDMAEPGQPPQMVALDFGEQMPTLVCAAPPGHPLHGEPVRLDISADPEGNGRGWLFGLISPPPPK